MLGGVVGSCRIGPARDVRLVQGMCPGNIQAPHCPVWRWSLLSEVGPGNQEFRGPAIFKSKGVGTHTAAAQVLAVFWAVYGVTLPGSVWGIRKSSTLSSFQNGLPASSSGVWKVNEFSGVVGDRRFAMSAS